MTDDSAPEGSPGERLTRSCEIESTPAAASSSSSAARIRWATGSFGSAIGGLVEEVAGHSPERVERVDVL